MDSLEQDLLADALRKTMRAGSGVVLDKALADLGWEEMVEDCPEIAIPLVFRTLGETGTHASVLNDLFHQSTDTAALKDSAVPLPFADGRWVEWSRDDVAGHASIDPDLPLVEVTAGVELPLAKARIAVGWWLVGTGHAMLDLARNHALDRTQFGRPIAAFQAVRHRLAETLVAIEGAEATLATADDEFGALLAKAAAGHAALTTSRHVQQVLGGVGFTAEHPFHRHARRVLILDALLGSSRELTRAAGAVIREQRTAPRLVHL